MDQDLSDFDRRLADSLGVKDLSDLTDLGPSVDASDIPSVGSAMPEVKLSQAAVSSVAAAVGSPSRERTDAEKEYDKVVASCVRRPGGHEQRPAPAGTDRLYTVTTIAASARYGGTRTPVICDSFDEACEIVEKNAGDIFETTYRLAVIEAVVPNRLYGGDLGEQYWWLWEGSYEDGRYVPVETPAAFVDRTGFAIG